MTLNPLNVTEITELCVVWENKKSRSDFEELRVFDERGKCLGTAPRLLCHRLGLIHKVAYCFIADEQRNVLLQTRGGGRLDVAVGGHVSASDTSVIDSLTREMIEEIGLKPKATGLIKIGGYLRLSSGRVEKPRDVNNELRDLYYYELAESEKMDLSEAFPERAEQQAVKAIQWFSLPEVLEACSKGTVADGLGASLPHFLLWLSQNNKM